MKCLLKTFKNEEYFLKIIVFKMYPALKKKILDAIYTCDRGSKLAKILDIIYVTHIVIPSQRLWRKFKSSRS
jgi:hypothetical protein